MIGKIHVLWLGLIGLSSGVLFHTSYEVQELQEKLQTVNREIIREQEAIQILKAEWAYLNEPGRIEVLARKYTALAPIAGVQLATSAEVVPPRVDSFGPAFVSAMPLPRLKPGSPRIAAAKPAPQLPAEQPAPARPFAAGQGQVADLPFLPEGATEADVTAPLSIPGVMFTQFGGEAD
ncbi:cell division protein FtsL [Arenibaculum pallidiluteum]|uniref:cell division protein FtsL n=1 Tax=Arenibaculum pallidiluteum TaxID=2812559 RepID=UPI001A95C473|nr:hypothetical protein [Arenibaculum pallidiluteum]